MLSENGAAPGAGVTGGPLKATADGLNTSSVPAPIPVCEAVSAALALCEAAEATGHRRGYIEGHKDGYAAGHEAARLEHAEAEREWFGALNHEVVRRTVNTPPYAELAERRGEPERAERQRELLAARGVI